MHAEVHRRVKPLAFVALATREQTVLLFVPTAHLLKALELVALLTDHGNCGLQEAAATAGEPDREFLEFERRH